MKSPTCSDDQTGITDDATPTVEARTGTVLSRELLGAQGELMINHHGRMYRLRVTQNNKLILTA